MKAIMPGASIPPTEPFTDAELCTRIGNGDTSALGLLFDRHSAAVRRFVARLGVRSGEVDDVVQITFLDVLKTAASYDGRASAKPWLLSMAAMRVRRHRRSFARLAERIAAFGREPEHTGELPDARAETNQAVRRAQLALADLSERKREVFLLVVLEGLTCEEVATALDIPVGTVWTRLHHARTELRASLSLEESP